MNEPFRINWYRCKVDKKVMSELMKTSDARGFAQVLPQLALFFTTGTLAYWAYTLVHVNTLAWSLPLLFVALFVHGTFSSFLGMISPVHELCHKTPFRTKAWNEFFLKVYSFFSWSDWVGFRMSHVKHHQVTTYHDHDGEVVLPQKFDWQSVKFFLTIFTCNPYAAFCHIRGCVQAARGQHKGWIFNADWMNKVIPESNVDARAVHRRWAQTLILGHLALATVFIATGHWFLIILFNFGTFYCGWLTMLCGTPQHLGMVPNVPDHRLCCRTFTCSWLPAFLYWNMQHHVEHHMFPAVPFYNLPKLRKAIEHDLPPAPHGLYATWKELLEVVRRQREDPTYVFVPKLPQNNANAPAERASDEVLELEASALAG
jgi:fatty acid desaturase